MDKRTLYTSELRFIPKVIRKLVLTTSALHQNFHLHSRLAKGNGRSLQKKILSSLLVKFQFLNHVRYNCTRAIHKRTLRNRRGWKASQE